MLYGNNYRMKTESQQAGTGSAFTRGRGGRAFSRGLRRTKNKKTVESKP